jgi:antitoxin PrlF
MIGEGAMLQANLTIAANGRLVIPANMRAQLGLQGGGKLVARLLEGAVILEPVETAVRRAQALVAKYVPRDAGLADELIAERRTAAEHE